MTIGMDMGVQMHQQAVDTHMQQAQQMHQQTMQQMNTALAVTPQNDCFVKSVGILPPKDWKPDPFAGLGPELTPQEKLKKKYEDLRKPMYMAQPEQTEVAQPAEEAKPKTFKEKVKAFGTKIKNYFKNLFS